MSERPCQSRTGQPVFRIRLACGFWQRARGLIGRSAKWLGPNEVLAFVPCNAVHTFFMTNRIDVAFVDQHGVVLAAHEEVPPCRFLRCSGAVGVLERFTPRIAREKSRWLAVGDHISMLYEPSRSMCSQAFREEEMSAHIYNNQTRGVELR